MGQGAPSTIRCIKTRFGGGYSEWLLSQGAPSTIRCIKTGKGSNLMESCEPSQGAPSTIRCIKTTH